MAVKSLRDAEFQIEALKRQQNELIKELKSLNLIKKSASDVQIITRNEVDSVLSADQNTVVHKLYHIFDRIKVRILEIIDLTLTNLTATTITTTDFTSTNATITNLDATNIDAEDLDAVNVDIRGPGNQLHYSDIDSEQGGYLLNIGNDIYVNTGIKYVPGVGWIAVNTTALVLHMSPAGWRFYYAGGLVVGGGVGLTLIMEINNVGISFIATPLSVSNGGTGTNTFTPGVPLIGNGTGAIGHPVSTFSGTVYVASTPGGVPNVAKTFNSGICTA